MSVFSVILFTAPPVSLGAEGNGAFVKIDGRESLLRAVELFLNRDNVKQIQLIVSPENLEEAKKKYGGHLSFSGVKLVSGGPKWLDQIAAGADKISTECSHAIIHDAARPAVASNDLEFLMTEVEKKPIVALATSLRNGLMETDESGKPIEWHSPQKYLQIVMPWAFRKDKLMEMAKNRSEPVAGEMWALRSSPYNVRVSGASDAGLIKTMIGMLPKPKIRAADNPFEEAQW